MIPRHRRLWRAGIALLAAAVALVPGAAPEAAAAGWRQVGLGGLQVGRLALDRSGPGILYAVVRGVPKGSVRKTVDGGRSWLPLERGLPSGFQPSVVASSPDDGRIVLAAAADGLYRSTSAGASWSQVRVPLPPLTAIAFDASNARMVLAGSELRGNFRSADGGVTWVAANLGLPRDHYGNVPGGVAFAQHPTEPQTLLMATNGFAGVYKSTDGGVSWHASGSGLREMGLYAIAYAPGAPDTVFAVTEKSLARSTDGGATWSAVGGTPVPDPVALEFEPGSKDVVYLAGTRGALFRSTNGGASWVELAALPRPVRSLAAWPTATGSVLAAAAGEGVWQMPVLPTLPASPLPASPNRQYFPETGHNVSTFLPYFRTMGGLERFGYPRTEEFVEDGALVQYFQRARLEQRPDKKGTPYEVQISLLGDLLLGQERPPREAPVENTTDQRYFEESGHTVSFAFLRYFNERGGLDSVGYPISEEILEGGRPVQYLQRARLEYREAFKGTRNEVEVGLIGDEVLRMKGWLD